MKKAIYTLGLFFILSPTLWAQDSAQDLLLSLQETDKNEPVTSTFKTTRVILSQSVETVKKYNLDYRITHRFGDAASPGAGFETLFGFDNSTDIRNGFEYGVSDQLTIGIGRSKFGILDGLVKYRALTQTTNNKIPVSITLFHSTGFETQKKVVGDQKYADYANRFSYFCQVIIARRFSKNFSLQIMPGFLHRNYVANPSDNNDLYSVGVSGRLKLTTRFGIIADTYFISSKLRSPDQDLYHPPLGLGIEIETGGHVFTINFTNSTGIIENTFIANTTSNWLKGEYRFGFTISRPFQLVNSKPSYKVPE